MSTLLHISDLHFGTEVVPVIQALLELHGQLNPELVILSGDVTQRAKPEEFALARLFLNELKPRQLLALPGNHDIPLFRVWERVMSPYSLYKNALGEDLEPCFESDDVLAVGVNTTRPQRWEDGEISFEQIQRVTERLERSKGDQLRIVVTHHPVHIVATQDRKNLVNNGDAAVHAWTAAGADLFLGGHIHLPYVRPLSEHHLDLVRPSWVVQAGTGTSGRVRGNIPNSVNVIRFNAPGDDDIARTCIVERWDFDSPCSAFKPVEQGTLTLGSDAASSR